MANLSVLDRFSRLGSCSSAWLWGGKMGRDWHKEWLTLFDAHEEERQSNAFLLERIRKLAKEGNNALIVDLLNEKLGVG